MIVLQKENEDDPDMAEMIDSEMESLSNQLEELEEKLKVCVKQILRVRHVEMILIALVVSCQLLLLPNDPLDARNILLEGTSQFCPVFWPYLFEK